LADLAWLPYVYIGCIPAIDSGLFPNVQAWYFRMASISDVRKGAIGAGWGFEHKRFMDLLARAFLVERMSKRRRQVNRPMLDKIE
jgi:hypothetical protein